MDIYVQKDGQLRGPRSVIRIIRGIKAAHFVIFLLLFTLLVYPSFAHTQQTTQEWQATATKEFPQLAVKDSPFNRVYLAAYAVLKGQASKSLNSSEIFYLLAVATSQVLASVPNGTLDPVTLGKAVANKIPELLATIAKIESRSFVAGAEVKEADSEGALCSTYTTKSIVHEEDHVEQNQTMLGPGMISHHVTKTVEVQKTPVSDNVFIAGIHNVAPSQEWTGRIWPAGTFDFHSAAGGSREVEQWAISRADAVRQSLKQASVASVTKNSSSPALATERPSASASGLATQNGATTTKAAVNKDLDAAKAEFAECIESYGVRYVMKIQRKLDPATINLHESEGGELYEAEVTDLCMEQYGKRDDKTGDIINDSTKSKFAMRVYSEDVRTHVPLMGTMPTPGRPKSDVIHKYLAIGEHRVPNSRGGFDRAPFPVLILTTRSSFTSSGLATLLVKFVNTVEVKGDDGFTQYKPLLKEIDIDPTIENTLVGLRQRIDALSH